MKVKLFDKFKALGAGAVGIALLAVPFVVPEALPVLPLALGGFALAATYANKKLSGKEPTDCNPMEDSGFSNHGMTKEDAIESLLAMRRKAMAGLDVSQNKISI